LPKFFEDVEAMEEAERLCEGKTIMSANVESVFYVRNVPWHGLEELVKSPEDASGIQKANVEKLRRDIAHRYFDAPDLRPLPKNGRRFINAVSDFATHAEPLRRTANHGENLFAKTVDGHPMIDRALQLMAA
jgi:hypothetical protein